MKNKIAENIGSTLAIKSVLIGLAIAYVIMTYFSIGSFTLLYGLLWIKRVEYLHNLIIGAIGLLAMGYFYGRQAGLEIITKGKNAKWVGIKYGILTLWTGTFIGSLIGFFEQGLNNLGTNDNPFVDYLIKPFFWITFFGIIPTISVGLWFGSAIKRKGLKTGDVSINASP